MNITNLKKLISFTLSFTKQLSESLADGLQWRDVIAFFDEMTQIPGLVRSWEEIKAELSNVSQAEKDELNRFIAATYDIPNEEVEVFTENALMAAVSLVALYTSFKELK